jgi:sulfatase maturation enzyme AslB (radical SAM superfamily)
MSVEVADAVAEAVAAWSEIHPVRVPWHGGESLATGLARFARLVGWFGPGRGHRVRHGVQTNSALWYADFSGVDVFLCRPCPANRYLEN